MVEAMSIASLCYLCSQGLWKLYQERGIGLRHLVNWKVDPRIRSLVVCLYAWAGIWSVFGQVP